MHWFGGGWGAMGILGMALMAVVWVAIIVGVVYLIKWAVSGSRNATAASPPPAGQAAATRGTAALQVLEERYARGDIARDEFLQRKADLLS